MLVLKSRYQEALQSTDERKEDRFRDVIDEYYSFINDFPESNNRHEADNIFKIASKHVKNYPQASAPPLCTTNSCELLKTNNFYINKIILFDKANGL